MLNSPVFEVTLLNKYTVELPYTIVKPFVEQKLNRIKVKATFEDRATEFHAALIKEKSGTYRMYFSNAKQKELGVFMNDHFNLQLFEDISKYGVDLSEELEAVLLSDYEGYTIFESLTPGKQRSMIYAIQRYKSSQTRVDKALLLMENLKRGIKDPKLWLKSN
ncbi:MAG: YdeI/OmpD-associated family protein [Bacteroidota bacterium]